MFTDAKQNKTHQPCHWIVLRQNLWLHLLWCFMHFCKVNCAATPSKLPLAFVVHFSIVKAFYLLLLETCRRVSFELKPEEETLLSKFLKTLKTSPHPPADETNFVYFRASLLISKNRVEYSTSGQGRVPLPVPLPRLRKAQPSVFRCVQKLKLIYNEMRISIPPENSKVRVSSVLLK